MIAQNDEFIREAAETIFRLSQDERIRRECEAREDYYRTQLGIQQMMDRQTAQIQSQAAEIDKLQAWIRAQGYDPSDI